MELGQQSACDATLARVRRGHTVADFTGAFRLLRSSGVKLAVHLIFGLPGEGLERILDTVRFVADLEPEGVKIHNLHVLEGTELARWYRDGKLTLSTLDEYARMAAEFLTALDPAMIIHRLTGESHGPLMLAPAWGKDKRRVLAAIEDQLRSQDTWQGHQQVAVE